MRTIPKYTFILLGVVVIAGTAMGGYYEPPINFFFIIHVESLLGGTGTYSEWLDKLVRLEDLLNTYPSHPKMTILMNGDFLEYVMAEGDSAYFRGLETAGHELGCHAHGIEQVGPFNWISTGDSTARYGQPAYNNEVTRHIWRSATAQLARLTPNIHSMCAAPFLCSTEGDLAVEFGYEVVPGNRSELCQDYLGHLNRHPMRCGTNDLYGHELEEDLSAPMIYLDHFAQIGNEVAHGYNATVPALMEAAEMTYDDWLSHESVYQDSLDYYVWTFGFLTHLGNIDDYYLEQIELFLNYLEDFYIGQYSAYGNLKGRYATSWDIAQEFMQWESVHPGWSSFNLVYEYPQNIKINEIMYKPIGWQAAEEWIELYNPTDSTYDLTNWRLRGAYTADYWQFPAGTMQPGQYIVTANNGQAFYNNYGFYPDYEVNGGTPAVDLIASGNFQMDDEGDAVVLQNTEVSAAENELNWVDAYSWGQSWHAGFCDTRNVPEGSSIGRDSISTDTDVVEDWQMYGSGAMEPTPGERNAGGLGVEEQLEIKNYELKIECYPNPFNQQLAVSFELRDASEVRLSIYDVLGREVQELGIRNWELGKNTVIWEAEGEGSGVYFVRLMVDGRWSMVEKVVLMK